MTDRNVAGRSRAIQRQSVSLIKELKESRRKSPSKTEEELSEKQRRSVCCILDRTTEILHVPTESFRRAAGAGEHCGGEKEKNDGKEGKRLHGK